MSDTALPTLKVPLTTQLLALVINKGTLFPGHPQEMLALKDRVSRHRLRPSRQLSKLRERPWSTESEESTFKLKALDLAERQRFVPFKTPALKLPA
tara:strand:+ start:1370 stop:1657 length:288 start_codon:yes stop_codon:yes gene_type:complete